MHAAAALRLLSGCRKNEILTLRWEDVDLHAMEMHIADTKTGARTVALSPGAARVFAGIPSAEGNPWVIQGRKKGRTAVPPRPLVVSLARANMEDVRIHDCRHSFASRALALGETLPATGKLLGHAHVETTARYAQLARDSMHEAAARVADSISGNIL